jgi:hypothetical protein
VRHAKIVTRHAKIVTLIFFVVDGVIFLFSPSQSVHASELLHLHFRAERGSLLLKHQESKRKTFPGSIINNRGKKIARDLKAVITFWSAVRGANLPRLFAY